MQIIRRPGALRAGRAAGAAVALAAATLTACDTNKIIAVKDPDVVQPGSINSVTALPTVLASAIGDVQLSVGSDGSGGNDGLISYGGLVSDEWVAPDTYPTRVEADRRTIQLDNTENQVVFENLQRARNSAETASDAFARLQPKAVGYGEALSLAGYTYVLTSEHYCSGVPFSRVGSDGKTYEYGTPLTTQQMLDVAVAKFDSAATALTSVEDADSSDIALVANLAAIGKARALLDAGQFDAAATAVADVPTDYSYTFDYSANTTRQQNGVWEFSNNEGRLSVADSEGGVGLPFRSANDPRVTFEDFGPGFDGQTELYAQTKYPDKDANIPLATGVEARLIEAEAALKSGQAGTFLSKINDARAAQGVDPLAADSVPAAADAQVDLLFRERAFALFLTAHRLGDMRRLVRAPAAGGYGRPVDSVFPNGPYFKSGTYGTDVSLPVPISERNNGNFTSCDPSQP